MGIKGTMFRMFIIAIMVFFASVSAEIKTRSIDVSPFIGAYFFENNMPINLDNRMHIGCRLGYNLTGNWGIEATGGYVSTETYNDFLTPNGWMLYKDTEVDFWTFHLDMLYHFFPDEQVNPYIAVGGGAFNIDAHTFDSDIDPLFNYGVGIKYFLAEWVAFRVDIRHLVAIDELDNFDSADKNLHSNLTYDVGLNFSLWGKSSDIDKDGIPNKVDKCPNEAEDKDGFEDEDGCPDLDNDRDGIPDIKDKCPNEAEDKDGFEDQDGCPDLDNDKDGVLDKDDKCPNLFGSKEYYGCPDRDGDGIYDNVDKCPDEAEDKDGFEDEDGCPDLDNDKDGILDKDDKCPDQAETFNGLDDEDGCPDAIILKKDETISLDNVYFKSGKADIVDTSFAALDKVKRIFVDNPGIVIQVEGHTDSQGSAASNKTLSKRRAETVMKYLVEKLGIPQNQLTAIGFGEEKPIADNRTNEGRSKNRRIEFRVMK
ncbi:MAG: outer membrane beta-barrel domain-containing protein [Candidatus Delongbacteria bacterium]|nr:outer membrane beta-barrel domain-containing protein [Candidatus Delongbacteria bacterium]MCG2760176.1 outer membrane beta-barrel domain-containing protein [Candidatus Delongbacteria bacterium]